jgi:uncharacterized protein (DUF1501 family)
MKRRDFIKKSSLLAGWPLLLNGQPLFSVPAGFFPGGLTSFRPDRKLVLVQLNGGNDGLNTFIPLDQYTNLQKARSNVMIPEKELLGFSSAIGINPSFKEAKWLFDEERLLLIQNVGYPQPNLSHFRSKDIVCSATDSDVVMQSGWLGRMLNGQHPDFPGSYPNDTHPHPLALTIGSTSSQTCQGVSSNFSSVIKNMSTIFTSSGGDEDFPDSPFGNELRYITGVMHQTEVYLDAISEAASKAGNLSGLYPESGNTLADQLKIVARLIAGGLQTQIYIVSLGGWDTHADQVEEGAPLEGRHGVLLSNLSQAIYAFQDDLRLNRVEDDVLGLVFTEFGRRIKSNDSFGTDHGTAWPAILFGSEVNPTVLGSNPFIPDVVEKQDNLAMQFDIRSIYASVFKEWFEADDESIRQVLFRDFEVLPILKKNLTGTPEVFDQPEIRIYPNPVVHHATLNISGMDGSCDLMLYSNSGRFIRRLSSSDRWSASERVFNFSDLPPGAYHIICTSRKIQRTVKFIKI